MLRADKFPIDAMPCWNIEDDERIKAIKEGKPYHNNMRPYLYFKLLKWIDSNYIEGNLGRMDSANGDEYHTMVSSTYSYFDNFSKRKTIYFTFDGVSLFQLTDIFQEAPLKLILKRVNTKTFKKNQAFMIMPFHNESLNEFYNDHIRDFLKAEFNIEIYRDDNFISNDIVTETIYKLIEESEFIIADTTLENKNAFYELGYAAALGKEIITVQNKDIDKMLFFDRAHIRTLLYDMEDIEKFQFELESSIKSIRSKT